MSYESWRYRDRPVTKAECQQCSYKWVLPKDCTTFADSISANDDRLTFSHRNRAETVFDFTVALEQLDAIKDSLYNPIGGLLMQGEMHAPGFRFTGTTDGQYASTDYRAWNYRCNKLKRSVVTISLNHQTTNPLNHQLSQKRSARWWHQFWQRSWIVSDTQNDSLQSMIRNYELMRYILACNAYGQWPTKFNGGLFTFDPVYVDSTMTFTPDYRKWGGGTMTALMTAAGVGGHASLPEGTVNAIGVLVNAILDQGLAGEQEAKFLRAVADLTDHSDGSGVGVEANDGLFQPLTIVGSMIGVENGRMVQTYDSRYPTNTSGAKIAAIIGERYAEVLEVEADREAPPFYMSLDKPEVQVCIRAYNEVTGENAVPYTIGGGTYARDFPNAVSFGPEHPERPAPDFAGPIHGVDEAACKAWLMEALKVYILALIELEKLEF